MSEDEKKKREALRKNKATAPAAPPASALGDVPPVIETTPPAYVAPVTDFPPPLPPIPAATPSPGAPTAVGVSPTLGDAELKGALSKTFQGSMKGLVRALNMALAKTKYELDPIEIDADEAGLWAEFAAPVFKQYFPKFQEDPKIALAVITGLILAGKVTVRKRSVPYVAEPEHAAGAS